MDKSAVYSTDNCTAVSAVYSIDNCTAVSNVNGRHVSRMSIKSLVMSHMCWCKCAALGFCMMRLLYAVIQQATIGELDTLSY